MSFKINSDALSFIKDKGFNEITVTVTNVKGGCTGSFKEIEVKLGIPKKLEDFEKTKVDGIIIYHPKSKFIKEGEFLLTLEKMLFLKKLVLRKIKR